VDAGEPLLFDEGQDGDGVGGGEGGAEHQDW
jgi:hypothetical protein